MDMCCIFKFFSKSALIVNWDNTIISSELVQWIRKLLLEYASAGMDAYTQTFLRLMRIDL